MLTDTNDGLFSTLYHQYQLVGVYQAEHNAQQNQKPSQDQTGRDKVNLITVNEYKER